MIAKIGHARGLMSMWWLWPHMKRLWAAAGTITAGLTINYLYGLWGNQSVLDLQRLSRVLWSYWGWTGGALTGFAIVSLFAARASRRHNEATFAKGAVPCIGSTSYQISSPICGRW